MCNTEASRSLPRPGKAERIDSDGIVAYAFGQATCADRVVIIPDIYGASAFYLGLATWFADKGARVLLLDPFVDLGELPSPTREAAFARRGKLCDKAYVDAVENFSRKHEISGVLGFCLGGLYVFELSRRRLPVRLVSLYGFPQGLPNQDPLPVPFDYLAEVSWPQLALFGEEDYLQTPENLGRLRAIAAASPHFDLHLYPRSGHGFLADLDAEDSTLRANANDALSRCADVLLASRAAGEAQG